MEIVPPIESVVYVVKATVTTAVVFCNWVLSLVSMVIDTSETAPKGRTIPSTVLTVSALVATVKPVAAPAVAAPVVSSPAAKVILCAPAAKFAVAVWQTILRVAAVIVQVDVNAALPAAGTRTPAGVAFPLK